MEKKEFDEMFQKSHDKLKSNVSGLEISKEELIIRIEKVLKNETKDIRLITQLKYLEKLSIKEIREILDKSETSIYHYLQYIIGKINSIIFEDSGKEFEKIDFDFGDVDDGEILNVKA
ncbi:MAG: hypothetical protein PHR68_05560 [Candidatus Gracilibacteria bacterium]|nr:hypothetical protein [Candidatus Gracilibacteria bacterium]